MRKMNWMNVGARWGCALGLAAAAVVAGCGGGGGGASAPPAPDNAAGPTGSEPRSALMVVAGTPGGVGLLDGRGAAARLGLVDAGFGISGLAVATDATVYISSASLIRRISPAGLVVVRHKLEIAGVEFIEDNGGGVGEAKSERPRE